MGGVIMERRGMPAAIGRTIAATSLVTALAAVVGVVLSGFGLLTPLVGTCGDLLPGPLSTCKTPSRQTSRSRPGTIHA